jgi:hypothetical protein
MYMINLQSFLSIRTLCALFHSACVLTANETSPNSSAHGQSTKSADVSPPRLQPRSLGWRAHHSEASKDLKAGTSGISFRILCTFARLGLSENIISKLLLFPKPYVWKTALPEADITGPQAQPVPAPECERLPGKPARPYDIAASPDGPANGRWQRVQPGA